MTDYEFEYIIGSKFSIDKVVSNERIVRCKDCELWEIGDCEWNPFCDDHECDEPDGFCKWGRRKRL